jgi:hypothetical protein
MNNKHRIKMTRITIFIFVILGFSLEFKTQSLHCSQDSIKEELNIDFKKELEKYNGFYTAIESTDGNIPIDKIPERIKDLKKSQVTGASIQYLQEIDNGYVFTYRVQFERYRILVISILDKNYITKDYRTYTDGTGAEKVENDTIAIPYFGNDYIKVEIMHPNKFNEPLFSVDGINRENLLIT